jgi:tRNA threonylcarbamoyladenosine biosynthesis protein TsaE
VTLITRSEQETSFAGEQLSRTLGPGSVVLLEGELGAGKTAFVRGLAAGLGVDPAEVSSPTFTLIQEYRGGRHTLYHVDLYRLRSEEVEDLGLDELVIAGGIVAIEWPDRLPRKIPGAVRVSLTYSDETTRTIEIQTSDVTPFCS